MHYIFFLLIKCIYTGKNLLNCLLIQMNPVLLYTVHRTVTICTPWEGICLHLGNIEEPYRQLGFEEVGFSSVYTRSEVGGPQVYNFCVTLWMCVRVGGKVFPPSRESLVSTLPEPSGPQDGWGLGASAADRAKRSFPTRTIAFLTPCFSGRWVLWEFRFTEKSKMMRYSAHQLSGFRWVPLVPKSLSFQYVM